MRGSLLGRSVRCRTRQGSTSKRTPRQPNLFKHLETSQSEWQLRPPWSRSKLFIWRPSVSLQNHSHLPGPPSVQRNPLCHAGGGADRWLCQVLNQGRQRDQPDEAGLGSGTEMLCFPTLGLWEDWWQPAGYWHARSETNSHKYEWNFAIKCHNLAWFIVRSGHEAYRCGNSYL